MKTTMNYSPAGAESNPVKILIQGGKAVTLNGLDFAPDGQLWAGSTYLSGVYRIDIETGAILESRSFTEGYKSADDLYIAKEGSMYWVNIGAGEIYRRWPDGTTKMIGKTDRPGPDGISMNREETRLFVADCFLNHNLYEVDIEGVNPPKIITSQLGLLGAFDGMRFGPDGLLYGTRWFEGTVASLDVNTGEFHDVITGFATPAALKFDNNDTMYIVDAIGGVFKADYKTGTKELVTLLPSTLDNLAFSPDNRLFVTSSTDGRIWEVIEGKEPRLVLDGGLALAAGMVLKKNANGNLSLFVTDLMGLWEFDALTGKAIAHAKDVAMSNYIYANIGTVSDVDLYGDDLLVSSSASNFVKIWDPREKRTKHVFKGIGMPMAVATIGENFAVANLKGGDVLLVKPMIIKDQPIPETAYFTEVLAHNLYVPGALTYQDGTLLVSDMATGQVLKIMENGKSIQPVILATGLQRPEGMDIDGDWVYVVEAGIGQLSRFSMKTGTIQVIASGMKFSPAPDFTDLIGTELAVAGVVVNEKTAWISGNMGSDGYVIYTVDLPD